LFQFDSMGHAIAMIGIQSKAKALADFLYDLGCFFLCYDQGFSDTTVHDIPEFGGLIPL